MQLFGNGIGNDGAEAVADALLQTSAEGDYCAALLVNRVGLRGQSAVLKAVEAARGQSFGHAIGLIMANPPEVMPHFSAQISRGQRALREAGQYLS